MAFCRRNWQFSTAEICDFPEHDDRPYVIGNFVSTLDGVVSFEVPGKSGGGDISGFNEADRFIMGLLRASADAAIVGSGTLREVAQGHLWLAEHVYPEARDQYARYRRQRLNKPQSTTERDCERQWRRRPPKGGVPHSRCKCSYPYVSKR